MTKGHRIRDVEKALPQPYIFYELRHETTATNTLYLCVCGAGLSAWKGAEPATGPARTMQAINERQLCRTFRNDFNVGNTA